MSVITQHQPPQRPATAPAVLDEMVQRWRRWQTDPSQVGFCARCHTQDILTDGICPCCQAEIGPALDDDNSPAVPVIPSPRIQIKRPSRFSANLARAGMVEDTCYICGRIVIETLYSLHAVKVDNNLFAIAESAEIKPEEDEQGIWPVCPLCLRDNTELKAVAINRDPAADRAAEYVELVEKSKQIAADIVPPESKLPARSMEEIIESQLCWPVSLVKKLVREHVPADAWAQALAMEQSGRNRKTAVEALEQLVAESKPEAPAESNAPVAEVSTPDSANSSDLIPRILKLLDESAQPLGAGEIAFYLNVDEEQVNYLCATVLDGQIVVYPGNKSKGTVANYHGKNRPGPDQPLDIIDQVTTEVTPEPPSFGSCDAIGCHARATQCFGDTFHLCDDHIALWSHDELDIDDTQELPEVTAEQVQESSETVAPAVAVICDGFECDEPATITTESGLHLCADCYVEYMVPDGEVGVVITVTPTPAPEPPYARVVELCPLCGKDAPFCTCDPRDVMNALIEQTEAAPDPVVESDTIRFISFLAGQTNERRDAEHKIAALVQDGWTIKSMTGDLMITTLLTKLPKAQPPESRHTAHAAEKKSTHQPPPFVRIPKEDEQASNFVLNNAGGVVISQNEIDLATISVADAIALSLRSEISGDELREVMDRDLWAAAKHGYESAETFTPAPTTFGKGARRDPAAK